MDSLLIGVLLFDFVMVALALYLNYKKKDGRDLSQVSDTALINELAKRGILSFSKEAGYHISADTLYDVHRRTEQQKQINDIEDSLAIIAGASIVNTMDHMNDR